MIRFFLAFTETSLLVAFEEDFALTIHTLQDALQLSLVQQQKLITHLIMLKDPSNAFATQRTDSSMMRTLMMEDVLTAKILILIAQSVLLMEMYLFALNAGLKIISFLLAVRSVLLRLKDVQSQWSFKHLALLFGMKT